MGFLKNTSNHPVEVLVQNAFGLVSYELTDASGKAIPATVKTNRPVKSTEAPTIQKTDIRSIAPGEKTALGSWQYEASTHQGSAASAWGNAWDLKPFLHKKIKLAFRYVPDGRFDAFDPEKILAHVFRGQVKSDTLEFVP